MAMISPPGAPRLSIKAVVLTRITINEVEKLRKWPSLWSRLGCFLSANFVNGARIFSLHRFPPPSSPTPPPPPSSGWTWTGLDWKNYS